MIYTIHHRAKAFFTLENFKKGLFDVPDLSDARIGTMNAINRVRQMLEDQAFDLLKYTPLVEDLISKDNPNFQPLFKISKNVKGSDFLEYWGQNFSKWMEYGFEPNYDHPKIKSIQYFKEVMNYDS